MRIVCYKCGLIQEKSSNCRNESCYHPFSKGGWSKQIDFDIKCNNCGNEEKLESKFCSNCGNEIPNNIIKYQKYCSVCLTNYDDEVNFCNKDGTALSKKKVDKKLKNNSVFSSSNTYKPSFKNDINIDNKTNLSKIPFIGTLILYAIIMGYLKTNYDITSLGAIPGAVFGFVITGTLAVFYYYIRKL
tara:strand:+ start:54 stop:614 length:561 start_codon:yes stop_codon:yes gene_type:complete